MTWARVEECGFTRTVMHQHVQSTSLQHSFQAGRHRSDSLHALPCSDRMQGEDTHSIELSEGRRVQVGGCQHLCQLRLLLLQNVAHCTAAARGDALFKTQQGSLALTWQRVLVKTWQHLAVPQTHRTQAVNVQSTSNMAQ